MANTKCGGCGQYLAVSACVRCTKCHGTYHPLCVGVTSTKVVPSWLCPGCKVKIPRTDNSATPVKGTTDADTGSTKHPATTEPSQTGDDPKAQAIAIDVAHEIRCFREELGAMRVELRQFREEMASLRTDVSSCREHVSAMESRVTCLESRFEAKEPSSYDTLESTIAELKIQLNERDQDMLLNDVIVAGIPETADESPLHIVKLIGVKLGVPLDERDVVYAERIGIVRRNFIATDQGDTTGQQRPRALAVRLTRRATRDQLLRAARVRRGMTTAGLELPGTSSRFYVNERLTPAFSKLFHNAREAGARHSFKYVWTKDGRILVKKEDGAKTLRIRSHVD